MAFYMVISHKPPCVTIAINATQRRKNLKSLLAQKAFVLGFPSISQVKEADYLGVESGYDADKLKNIGFSTSRAKSVNAPVIHELRLSLECEVVHTVTVGSHTQVTGEVTLWETWLTREFWRNLSRKPLRIMVISITSSTMLYP
ncbi:MAG: flavin reductase family protein [Selenomonas sp.]|uniref:flavin reductase family protein n=1 Tax=Selenomonas sp. TaxID=2053611 RepID=UPI0025E1DE99|nr:flavin reductase family protein [Selenomonas sp.]MCR5758251.1 flavin reductase family protein [Selenomonas sp.]